MGRLILLSIMIMAISISAGYADSHDDHDEAYLLRQAGDILPLEEILEISRQKVQGKVLEVELEHEHGQLIYELEILDNKGIVWELKINAKTGKFLKKGREE